jgi:GrpB-like predicted nucleotidyltransferase (UPF0157 family)
MDLSQGGAMGEQVELIGGVEKRIIAVVDYDAAWPDYFEVERSRIDQALANVPHRVVHVGSTSVTGVSAKPIVDLQLSVSEVEDEGSYTEPHSAASAAVAADRTRSGAEQRAGTTATAITRAAHIGTSGMLACGKQARRQAMRATPRTGNRGY